MKQKFLIRLDTQFTQAHSVGYFEFPIILVVKNHTTMEKDRIMEKHNVHACKCNFMRHENLYATKEHPKCPCMFAFNNTKIKGWPSSLMIIIFIGLNQGLQFYEIQTKQKQSQFCPFQRNF